MARVTGGSAIVLTHMSFAAVMSAALAQSGYYSPRQSYGYDNYSYSKPATWNGGYGGVQLGYGFGSVETGYPASATSGNNGGVGGIYLGNNWQNGGMLLGVEGELSVSWAGGTNTSPYSMTMSAGTAWLGTLRGRVGYSFGSTLIYATGGGAMTRTDVNLSSGSWSAKTDDLLLGWVLGAGLEYKFSPSISTRIEALHYRFGDKEISTSSGVIPYNADQTVIRAGLTLHLK